MNYVQNCQVLANHDKDKDGFLQESEMGGLLQEFWNHTDAAFAVRYWQAMNAYNTDTNGVNVDDFTTCWVHFD